MPDKTIDQLKDEWLANPCWDIERTEGFEGSRDELLIFRLRYELQQAKKEVAKLRYELYNAKKELSEYRHQNGAQETHERVAA